MRDELQVRLLLWMVEWRKIKLTIQHLDHTRLARSPFNYFY